MGPGARQQKGAPGIDQTTIAQVEQYGVDRLLDELAADLKAGSYRPLPARRVFIPKPGRPDERRPLSIPTVRDRVVQTALKLVIEPIFEADFLPCSFGFRPRRAQHDALQVLVDEAFKGRRWVAETDIASCFGSIEPERLVLLVERRIADGYVLALIRAWLRAGVMEGEHTFRNQFGVPQGGPISPLLSNIYLHELDREWAERGYEHRRGLDAKLIRYADDILIVSSKPVAERLQALLAEILGGLGLTLSPEKTRLTTATEGFDFLGFRFKRSYSRKHRREMNHVFPTPTATKRARERVRTVLSHPGISGGSETRRQAPGGRRIHTHASPQEVPRRASRAGGRGGVCIRTPDRPGRP